MCLPSLSDLFSNIYFALSKTKRFKIKHNHFYEHMQNISQEHIKSHLTVEKRLLGSYCQKSLMNPEL